VVGRAEIVWKKRECSQRLAIGMYTRIAHK
jgi:hypothetical protein